LNYRPPRVGRNPKTGEKVQVPRKYVPHFKAGKELRERVDFPRGVIGHHPRHETGSGRVECALPLFFRRHTHHASLVWLFRFAIVLVLVWFAVKNAQPVTLHGLPDQTWQAPLVFVLLVVFVAGVVIGLLAWLPTVVRQRREMARPAQGERRAVPRQRPTRPGGSPARRRSWNLSSGGSSPCRSSSAWDGWRRGST
jgi:uncharacterized integral membrane protein